MVGDEIRTVMLNYSITITNKSYLLQYIKYFVTLCYKPKHQLNDRIGCENNHYPNSAYQPAASSQKPGNAFDKGYCTPLPQ